MTDLLIICPKQYMKGEYSLVELDAVHTLIQEQFDRFDQGILNHI